MLVGILIVVVFLDTSIFLPYTKIQTNKTSRYKSFIYSGLFFNSVVWAGAKWLSSIDLQPLYRKRAKRRTSNVILLIETSSVLAEKVKTATKAATPS